jgi:hypothetical protein
MCHKNYRHIGLVAMTRVRQKGARSSNPTLWLSQKRRTIQSVII